MDGNIIFFHEVPGEGNNMNNFNLIIDINVIMKFIISKLSFKNLHDFLLV